jgi:N-glycosylase/DNA lyase
MNVFDEDLDIRKIADSGQCFRLTEETPGRFLLRAKGRALRLRALPDGAEFSCSPAEYDDLWRDYFDMDTDYAAFRRAIPPADGYLSAAADFGRGIRILRQEPWETLATFLISQRKNIPAIRRAVETLCARYGDPIPGDGGRAFPGPERLAALEETDLRDCSLGYRAPYLLAAARMTAEAGPDFAALHAMEDDALLTALQAVPGVGVKVASCTALFGFHRLRGFPRDVWINRIIDEEYGGDFPLSQVAGFEGVAQQYIFYYARSRAGRIR